MIVYGSINKRNILSGTKNSRANNSKRYRKGYHNILRSRKRLAQNEHSEESQRSLSRWRKLMQSPGLHLGICPQLIGQILSHCQLAKDASDIVMLPLDSSFIKHSSRLTTNLLPIYHLECDAIQFIHNWFTTGSEWLGLKSTQNNSLVKNHSSVLVIFIRLQAKTFYKGHISLISVIWF